jgi:replicative DNA helicase
MTPNEAAVLGSVLTGEPSAAREAFGFLEPEDFSTKAARNLFSILARSRQEGKPMDSVSIAGALPPGELQDVGGAEAILALTNAVPSALHVSHYGENLRRARLETEFRQAARVAVEDPSDQDRRKRLSEALQRLESSAHSVRAFAELATPYLAELDARILGKSLSVKTGFPTLDRLTGGLAPGALLIVGARTSRGKTSLLLKIALRMASDGLRGLFLSAEMTAVELMDRLLAMRTGLPLWRLRAGPDRAELGKVTDSMATLQSLPLHVADGGKFTLQRVLSAVEALGPAVVFVDYIQRFTPSRPGDNRAAFFSDVANGLKSLALQRKIVIVAASQLNRELEGSAEKTPGLHHLKESGGLEEAGDVVVLLGPGADPDRPGVRHATLHVAKNRHGPLGTVPMIFREETTEFFEHE